MVFSIVCDGPARRLLTYPLVGAGGLGEVALDTTDTCTMCSAFSPSATNSTSVDADRSEDASRSLYNSSRLVRRDTHLAVASLAVMYDKANPAVRTPPTVADAPLPNELVSLRRGCRRFV